MTDAARKIFVLDTSVVLYDFTALQNFQEHDVALPIAVLEELKKGSRVLELQALEFNRELDRHSEHNRLQSWIPLDGPDRGSFRVIAEEDGAIDAGAVFGARKANHRILNTVLALSRREAG